MAFRIENVRRPYNNVGITVPYCDYLVPCRLSTDLKIRDLEWPGMAILR